ncbi:tetratricopeptide repeat protein [Pendulispora rubella]|uniref:Tetratricopeptide repeat protein n=1 Tax=Pendulispora rubella TaxID=2741070 RepID=A0ABZ2L5C2_9BACT
MLQRVRHLFAAAIVCATANLAHAKPPPSEPSSPRALARQIGDQGFAALDRGDWRAAEAFFRRADAVYHVPPMLLGLARAEVQLGQLAAATEHYQRIIDEGPPPDANAIMLKAIESAKKEIGPVKARCARLVVRVAGFPAAPPPPFVVTLDDAAIPNETLGRERLLDPGPHRIVVRAEGYLPAETSVTSVEGGSHDISLALTREAPPETAAPVPLPEPMMPPPRESAHGGTQRTLGFVALGVGGAGLVTGALSGLLAIGARSSLTSSACSTGCDRAALDAYDSDRSRYQTTSAIATVGFTVAAVGGITGAVLLLTAPTSRTGTRATIMPYADASSIGAVGRF